jgi:ABC-2 type transport system ATP-binding protein
VIEVEHLTKRYGPVTAVHDVSFQVGKGEILGFLGPNGAGKTTTMRVLTGYMPATEGRVRVGGHDVFEQAVEAKRRIGYLPETPPLYPDMTVREYLHFVSKIKGVPAAERKARVDQVMARTWVSDMANRACGKLSKGYRQRVGLAQAIIHNPDVLVLDEPTAGLDPMGREEMLALVARLGTFGISVLMATHLLDDVQQVCDQVVMIDAGRLVVAGATASLLERTGLLTVDVGPRADVLVSGLAAAGMQATEIDGRVEVTIDGDSDVDRVRDTVADLGLPLYQLSTRLTSLDEVFMRQAASAS